MGTVPGSQGRRKRLPLQGADVDSHGPGLPTVRSGWELTFGVADEHGLEGEHTLGTPERHAHGSLQIGAAVPPLGLEHRVEPRRPEPRRVDLEVDVVDRFPPVGTRHDIGCGRLAAGRPRCALPRWSA